MNHSLPLKRIAHRLRLALIALAVLASMPPVRAVAAKTAPSGPLFDLVDNHCTGCHNPDQRKGELDLEGILAVDVTQHLDIWEKVLTRVGAGQMPPPKRKRPDPATLDAALVSLTATLDQHAAKHPNPGRGESFRRLNRTEYQNAIRDLLAVEIDAAKLLPQDEESHGFDNITVGTLSPALLDRYITAAQRVSQTAVGRPSAKVGGDTFRIPADFTQEKHIAGLPLGTRGGALFPYNFPQDGEYEIEVRLARDRNEHVEGLNGAHEMDILLDGKPVKRFTVSKAGKDHSEVDAHLKLRTTIQAGPRELGVTFVARSYSVVENKRQPFEAAFNLHRHPRLSPAVYQISITGPFSGKGADRTPSRDKIFRKRPGSAAEEEPAAREILGRLMKLAYRRGISPGDLDKPMAFYKEGAKQGGFDAGIEAALKSILVSPEFLFRIERDPAGAAPGTAYRISDLELASRLSFFLWSSIPDEELLDLAIAGRLRDSATFEKQVRRLLADPRALNLVNNFANQWLHLRNLDSITPDLRLFPDFDDNLRQAFREETELFVASILREDRSVLDLIKADYTYLNGRLAHHYGIPGVVGSRFRRVIMEPGQHRGGLLRQGSILTVTSYATRTSPVIRGNWVLENIIGTPAPPPPGDVPALENAKVDANASPRERLAQHRANPACASCHDLMDPVGFALENFDAVGRWREFENGAPMDVLGGLPDGSEFAGVENLETGLLRRPELFVGTLSRKLLTFALGRGVEAHDAPAIRQIVRDSKADNYRFSDIILRITESVPFQMRATAAGKELAGRTN